MTAIALEQLATLLAQLDTKLEKPIQDLEQICRTNPADPTARRAINYLGTLLWNARHALYYINQLQTANASADAGSPPAGSSSERSDFSRS